MAKKEKKLKSIVEQGAKHPDLINKSIRSSKNSNQNLRNASESWGIKNQKQEVLNLYLEYQKQTKAPIYTSYSKLDELRLITIGLASANRIRQWAEKTLPNGNVVGEVTNANTLHHKTFKPVKGGLFCERIFGPLKDFECACSSKVGKKILKYKKAAQKSSGPDQAKIKQNLDKIIENKVLIHNTSLGLVKNYKRFFCPECDVEYTWSVMRRYQLGYIKLNAPITHVWYVKSSPSYISLFLDMKRKDVEHITYCNQNLTLENALKFSPETFSTLTEFAAETRPTELYAEWEKVATPFLSAGPLAIADKKLLKTEGDNSYDSIKNNQSASVSPKSLKKYKNAFYFQPFMQNPLARGRQKSQNKPKDSKNNVWSTNVKLASNVQNSSITTETQKQLQDSSNQNALLINKFNSLFVNLKQKKARENLEQTLLTKEAGSPMSSLTALGDTQKIDLANSNLKSFVKLKSIRENIAIFYGRAAAKEQKILDKGPKHVAQKNLLVSSEEPINYEASRLQLENLYEGISPIGAPAAPASLGQKLGQDLNTSFENSWNQETTKTIGFSDTESRSLEHSIDSLGPQVRWGNNLATSKQTQSRASSNSTRNLDGARFSFLGFTGQKETQLKSKIYNIFVKKQKETSIRLINLFFGYKSVGSNFSNVTSSNLYTPSAPLGAHTLEYSSTRTLKEKSVLTGHDRQESIVQEKALIAYLIVLLKNLKSRSNKYTLKLSESSRTQPQVILSAVLTSQVKFNTKFETLLSFALRNSFICQNSNFSAFLMLGALQNSYAPATLGQQLKDAKHAKKEVLNGVFQSPDYAVESQLNKVLTASSVFIEQTLFLNRLFNIIYTVLYSLTLKKSLISNYQGEVESTLGKSLDTLTLFDSSGETEKTSQNFGLTNKQIIAGAWRSHKNSPLAFRNQQDNTTGLKSLKNVSIKDAMSPKPKVVSTSENTRTWTNKYPQKIVNNIYCLSHRLLWEQEKDWYFFALYYYGFSNSLTSIQNSVFNLEDIAVPAYVYRNYDFSLLNTLFTNKPTSVVKSYGSTYSYGYRNHVTTSASSPANVPLNFTQEVPDKQNLHVTFSGAGMLKTLLEEFDYSELKKMDKQNRILLYDLNKYIRKVKKRISLAPPTLGPQTSKEKVDIIMETGSTNNQETLKKYFRDASAAPNKKLFKDLCKQRDVIIRRTKLIRKVFINAVGRGADNPLSSKANGDLKASKHETFQNSTFEALTKGPMAFNSQNSNKLASMILNMLPVLPPDLRPIVKMGTQIAASDLNRLYQRVIYRNDRLKRFLKDTTTNGSYEMKYGQRLLQEAVDNLIQNGKSGVVPEKDARGRSLKSLSDILKGKQGRFRQYLLGKRVDYSGRSVIVVGPKLKLHECGIPKEMALELFLPFLIKRILTQNLARTVIGAKSLIKNNKPLTWSLLREIFKTNPVLLNRAPTLHRLGFQAFQPKLVDGRAILLHPLVCPAFNADFDGDQMAVHVPISTEARAEAWKLMLSRNNLLSPATGEPLVLPSQDMVLGCYYLTTNSNLRTQIYEKGYGMYFDSIADVLRAYNLGFINIHAIIWLKWNQKIENTTNMESPIEIRVNQFGSSSTIYSKSYTTYNYSNNKNTAVNNIIRTTAGKILFNTIIQKSLISS